MSRSRRRLPRSVSIRCGVKCLTGLRQAMIIDELTLYALANAVSVCRPEDLDTLQKAQKGRAAR
jgi:hypothetical protein